MRLTGNMLKVTYFGTTTLLFDDGRDQILFDAHVTRPSLLRYAAGGKAETNCSMCDELIRLHHIDRLRAIFISHTHHDHVMDAPYIAKQCNAMIYGSLSAKNAALGGGVLEDHIAVFSHGSTYAIGDYRIRILNSIHSKPTILNNDLGQMITEPLVQPAGLREYKEGGSYDFFIEHGEKKLLIRPSFNYIRGQLDHIRADVIFLGVAGLAKADEETEKTFFAETVEKTGAKLVIPVHWDNFFSPLDQPVKRMPVIAENTELSLYKAARYCELHELNFLIQYPRTSIVL